ncbi:AAA family ATPase [Leptolyngbya sp. NK1-12]|uniref:AAA family ATPase n=1 Tax=Leptolyngbya sp. NK1-12 TaxID=2547451 RepID=A0AA96WCL7_9CYAN|nr:AAA family ATPase [Leptolyngbya sp. NK1-12]
MTADEALAILDQVLQQEHLSDVQEIVFRQCWVGQTYAEIAENVGYDTGYIKDVGAKLWQFLSTAFGEKVTKNNIQAVLRRYQQTHPHPNPTPSPPSSPPTPPPHPLTPSPPHPPTHCDWGDAIDVSSFYGRAEELQTLTQWLTESRCRVVSLLGMGGIGKTSLSVKLAQQLATVQSQPFRHIIWRSLRNAPTAAEMLADWLRYLSPQPETDLDLPEDLNGRLTRLIQELRAAPCLLILDNAETILRSGEYSGYFRPEHEGYGEIFKRLAELPHRSCLLLTSRESPRPLMVLEGETLPVRAMRLSGISEAEARKILQAKGSFAGTPTDWQELTRRYGGNPLALKVVATTIQELFDGDIAAFLAEGTTVFDDIRYLLGQQFDRLSHLEQGIMYWLAINREPMLIAELQADLIPAVSKSKLIEAIGILRWRSLIEKTANHYTQQPVIMEYVTERLIERVCQEIVDDSLFLFIRHALIKAPVKDYVRDSQIRVILQPLIDRLMEVYRSNPAIEAQLNQILQHLQREYKNTAGYAGGNLLNLFRQLGTDLTGYSFAELPIWHAYLPDVPLLQVDFSQTHIDRSVFAQTLGSILSVAFSPDGQLLASSDADGEICLWQVADGKQLFTCKEEQNHWVWSVAFSPDSQLLASSSEDKLIRLWDVNTGECLQELAGHTNWVFAVAFAPQLNDTDSYLIASSSEDQTIKLWDSISGDCLATFTGHRGGVRTIAFSPDGEWLASGSSDQTVRLWQTQTGLCQQVLEDHTDTVRSLTFSPNGQWLASCSDDQTIRLWDLSTGDCERVFVCNSRTWSVAFSPDSQFILSASDDRIRLWEISTEEPIRSFEGHTGMGLTVAFSPDGKTAVSGSDDQTIKFWEVDTGRCLKTVKGHNNWVWSVAFSPDGQQLASGNEDHTIRLWQLATGRCIHTLEGHTGRVWSVSYSPRGQLLASGSDDQTIRFWQVDAHDASAKGSKVGRCIKTLRGQTRAVRLVVFSPDGLILASNSGDRIVKLWDVSSVYANEPGQITMGRITAGRSGEWVSGQCLAVLEGHEGRVFTIAFSPDSQQLATGSEDQTVRLWDMTTGTCLDILSGHTKPVEAVAYSPDGTLLASGSDDGTVRLWQRDRNGSAQLQVTLNPEVGRVLTIAFSADSTLLAIGGSNPVAVLWDIKAGKPIATLSGHSKAVPTLSFSPTGQYLATGSEDETIRVWTIDPPTTWKLLRAARPYEGLNLTDVTGLTAAQKATLKLLGAVEF